MSADPRGRASADALDRALATLPSPPPPPSFERLLARIEGLRTRRRAPLGAVFAVAAGVVVAASLVARLVPDRAGPERAGGLAVRVERAPDAEAPVLTRNGAPIAAADVRAGDEITAPGGASFTIDDPVSGASALVTLGRGSRLRFVSAFALAVHSGRAHFSVFSGRSRPGAGPSGPGAGLSGSGAGPSGRLRVEAGSVPIVDRGTRFGVDVARDASGERVLVTVTEGEVEAAGVGIGAGHGLAFVDGRALGPSWPLDAKPSLSIESETALPTAGTPVVLAIVLSNPTDGWIPWPSSASSESPIHVEVTDAAGTVTMVRVTEAMIVDGDASGRAVPPRGRAILRVRFDRALALPGAYRLRAIFRPAERVESPTSPSISLTVRESDAPRASESGHEPDSAPPQAPKVPR